MKKTVKAKIRWVSHENGGRTCVVPIGLKYCPLIIFDNLEPDNKGQTTWSAEIYNTDITESNVSLADVSYLMPNGPMELLQLGNIFNLYEGHNLVAKGAIISE